jgi:hypothetical protein
LTNDSDKHRLKSLKARVFDGHALQCQEAIQLSNQKTAGDSETASDVDVASFAVGLLLADFVDLGRRV